MRYYWRVHCLSVWCKIIEFSPYTLLNCCPRVYGITLLQTYMYFKKYVNDSRIIKSLVSMPPRVYKLWLTNLILGVAVAVRGHEILLALVINDNEQSFGHLDYNTHLSLYIPLYGDRFWPSRKTRGCTAVRTFSAIRCDFELIHVG